MTPVSEPILELAGATVVKDERDAAGASHLAGRTIAQSIWSASVFRHFRLRSIYMLV
jgi:hypothetical protein